MKYINIFWIKSETFLTAVIHANFSLGIKEINHKGNSHSSILYNRIVFINKHKKHLKIKSYMIIFFKNINLFK